MSDEQKAPPEEQPSEAVTVGEAKTTGVSRPKRKRKPGTTGKTSSTAKITTQALAASEEAPIEAPAAVCSDTTAIDESNSEVRAAAADGAQPQETVTDTGFPQPAAACEPQVTAEPGNSEGPPASIPAQEPPQKRSTPAGLRKFRSKGAYWTAGAIAAGMLIGVLWFRLQAVPDTNEVTTAGVPPAPTALEESNMSPAVGTDRPQLATRALVESTPTVEAERATMSAGSDSTVTAQQFSAEGSTAAAQTSGSDLISSGAYAEGWGEVMSHFMNPFSYMRIAGQVMGSVMQAWGVIPQQPTQ